MNFQHPINEYILSHPEKSHAEVAVRFGVTKNAIRKRRARLRDQLEEHSTSANDDSEIAKLKQRLLALNQKYNWVLQDRDNLKKLSGIFVDAKANCAPVAIKATAPKAKESAVVIVASDWHLEEVVRPETVSGLNAFDADIAARRVAKFFDNATELTKQQKEHSNVTAMVIAVLGDMISNTIHDELKETNSMMPADAVVFCANQLAGGIKHLVNECAIENVVVVCKIGNHGRFTQKIRHATERGNSLEYLLYKLTEAMLSDLPSVEFRIEESYHTYVDLFGSSIRFHHGHSVNYYGGVGGLYIPVNKAIAQWNKGKRADLDVFGHFHQAVNAKDFVCNSSLIGYSPYSVRIKAEYERPSQTFFVWDKVYGKTLYSPIYVEVPR